MVIERRPWPTDARIDVICDQTDNNGRWPLDNSSWSAQVLTAKMQKKDDFAEMVEIDPAKMQKAAIYAGTQSLPQLTAEA